jgi:glycosyltransferase involved in cell wall biosynthesis
LHQANPSLAGRHIVCFTRYGAKGPSSRLRFHLYQSALEEAGASVTFCPLLSDDYLVRLYAGMPKDKLDIARGYLRRMLQIATARADLAWVEKELFPFLPGTLERLLELKGIPYVVDFDDAIFHNYDLKEPGLVRSLLANKLDPLLAGSALVTAGNSYLLDYALTHGAPAGEVVPTVLDARRYPVRPAVEGERIRVGWIGTPTNERYLAPVVRALNALKGRLPLTLVTVGAGQLDDLGIPQERHTWSEESEGELVASFDIGVMPLNDTPWERGKCGYKLIQYMAAARPVIASAVGVNPEIVTPEVGRLVAADGDWAAPILELGSDPALRAAMGNSARQRVEAVYSLEATGPRIVELLAGVLARRAR